ncbi:MAG: phosphatase PAP2 family protein [Methylophilaceae bacterium]
MPLAPNIEREKTMWVQQIKLAFNSHVLLKCIGLTIFISLFFTAYFYVLNHPAFPVTVIPNTYLDRLIGFQPLALPIYLSLWVYVAFPAMLTIKLRELYEFTLSIALMSTVGLVIFYFWPTTIPVNEIDWALHPSINFLKSVDAAGNACPSLHVATALFSGAWLGYILRRTNAPFWVKAINIIWCVSIIYSTLATRQHVVLDVLGGLVLASISILLARQLFWQE